MRHGLVFDAARGEMVLFAGLSMTSVLNDTWTWNGTTWTRRTPAASPGARYGVALAYDSARSLVIAIAGFPGTALSESWTWNGTTWAPEPAAPFVGRATAGVFDTFRSELVVYGVNPRCDASFVSVDCVNVASINALIAAHYGVERICDPGMTF